MLTPQNCSIFCHSSSLQNRLKNCFIVLYISTAQGNRPRRSLNTWTRFHGFEKHSRVTAICSCALLSGTATRWTGVCRVSISFSLGPPGQGATPIFAKTCPDTQRFLWSNVLEKCYLAFSPPLHARPSPWARPGLPSQSAEWGVLVECICYVISLWATSLQSLKSKCKVNEVTEFVFPSVDLSSPPFHL